MVRAFAMIAVLVACGACGAAVYTHVRNDGLPTFLHRLGLNQSGGQAADDELLSAGVLLENDRSAYGTYRRTNLSHFKGLTLAYASDQSYCVQVEKAGKWYHLTGPEGLTLGGAC